MALPIFQTADKDFSMMQTKWASELNPLLRLPLNNGILITDIPLVTGANVVNHRLGRKPQGFIITDINAVSTIYRSQPFNDLTITLTASAGVTVSMVVF